MVDPILDSGFRRHYFNVAVGASLAAAAGTNRSFVLSTNSLLICHQVYGATGDMSSNLYVTSVAFANLMAGSHLVFTYDGTHKMYACAVLCSPGTYYLTLYNRSAGTQNVWAMLTFEEVEGKKP